MTPAQAPIVEEPEAEAAATAGAKVPDVRPDIVVVIDIPFAGNLILFHLEYHWFPTLLFPSAGLRYLSHCSTPLPCCMEHVLVALVFAAICAVLYYVQLYWVSIMQCLLAFVLFHHLRCVRFQVLRTTEGDFDPTYLTIKPERSDSSQASAIVTIKIAAVPASCVTLIMSEPRRSARLAATVAATATTANAAVAVSEIIIHELPPKTSCRPTWSPLPRLQQQRQRLRLLISGTVFPRTF